MNQAELEAIVREQTHHIRLLQEQMAFVLEEIERTQIQTNRALRHMVNIIRGLQSGL